ncbi:hypothetical protein [Methylicorpusculum sp.]|uniref:hypothetical protein n=1 Tax=Methylicorpusculum sp. TaxID=2713644 RepID=UPI00273081DE|nr:hypothetical protein [Methylicorpusculum sp.]MDP3530693.1 hypothetical protein [Methylicorpusculum sp.]MDZ4150207.1 hypothetical protein [Methylicorpusculum sp.]
MDNAACLTVYQPGSGNPSNSQFEEKKGWEKLFEDVGSRDAAGNPSPLNFRNQTVYALFMAIRYSIIESSRVLELAGGAAKSACP